MQGVGVKWQRFILLAAFGVAIGLAHIAPSFAQAGSQVCMRLERELARLHSVERSSGASEQISRFHQAVNQQQENMGIMRRQLSRAGCPTDSYSALRYGGQCRAMGERLMAMERNLESLLGQISRMEGRTSQSGQIRNIQAELQRNRCFEQAQPTRVRAVPDDFNRYPNDPTMQSPHQSSGGWGNQLSPQEMENLRRAREEHVWERSNTLRTVCVRTCDGFFFPVSLSTTRSRVDADAQSCQAQCPAAEAKLFYFPSRTGDMNSAVAMDGTRYMDIENAMRYQREFVPNCACHTPEMITERANMSVRADQEISVEPQTVAQKLHGLELVPLPPERGETFEVAKAAEKLSQRVEESGERKVRVILSFPAVDEKPENARLAAGVRPVPGRDPDL